MSIIYIDSLSLSLSFISMSPYQYLLCPTQWCEILQYNVYILYIKYLLFIQPPLINLLWRRQSSSSTPRNSLLHGWHYPASRELPSGCRRNQPRFQLKLRSFWSSMVEEMGCRLYRCHTFHNRFKRKWIMLGNYILENLFLFMILMWQGVSNQKTCWSGGQHVCFGHIIWVCWVFGW